MLRAAAATGALAAVVIPSDVELDLQEYRAELGNVPIVVTPRRTSPLMLLHPRAPYVVASRPVPRWLVDRVRAVAPDATGIVVTSYKSHRIGAALARGMGLPAVVRQHNREGAYHRALADATRGPRGWALRWDARRIARDEERLGRADWVTGTADISADDARWRRSTGARAVQVPPFAVGISARTPDRSRRDPDRVVFVGALDVATNVAALRWFLGEVWPGVREGRPDARIDVVGRAPGPEVLALVASAPGARVHADVPDVSEYLGRAAVAVNPAISGSGVNIKLVEYVEAGVPVVTTSLATRGLPLERDTDLLVTDEPAQFARDVLLLLDDPTAAAGMAGRAREHLRQVLDPDANLDLVDALMSAAAEV